MRQLNLLNLEVHQREVLVDVSTDLPVLVGDRIRLREVLQNLIENALKYMGNQPKPRIEIGARREADEPIIYVRDNGMGIDPRYHDSIFGLFDQLDQQTEGSGVGLALVRRIIELHGGRVWVGIGRSWTRLYLLLQDTIEEGGSGSLILHSLELAAKAPIDLSDSNASILPTTRLLRTS